MLVDSVVYKRQLTAYVKWIAQSAMLLSEFTGENVTEDSAYQDAADVVQFEIDLAKVRYCCFYDVAQRSDISFFNFF